MGEFSAGKSTLLNLLLTNSVLQTRVTATNMPVVWLTYGKTPQAQSLSRDNILKSVDIEALDQEGGKDHLLIRLALPSEILKRTDIIDTPGISDGRLSVTELAFLGSYLDAVIWCSPANQAWRQTEKTMWVSLPEGLRDNSFLALTRTDTLRKSSDLKKVVRRCENETVGLFTKVLPISALQASEARNAEGRIVDPALWESSCADGMLAEIDRMIETSAVSCDARKIVELHAAETIRESSETALAKSTTVKSTTAKVEKVSNLKVESKKTEKIASKANEELMPVFEAGNLVLELKAKLFQLGQKVLGKDQFKEQFNHILTTFMADDNLPEGQLLILNQALLFEQHNHTQQNLVVAQIIRELDDFENDRWHTLE